MNYTTGGGPAIWIVDSEQWPRAALRAELLERGYEAVGFLRLADALERLRTVPTRDRPRAVVLELRGQEAGREALEELARSGAPVILLGGEVELSEPSLRSFEWAATLRRPITLGSVADLVEKTVSRG